MLTEDFITMIDDCEREPYIIIHDIIEKMLKKNLYHNDMWGIIRGEKVLMGNQRKEFFDVMNSIFYSTSLDNMLHRLRWWWLNRPEYFLWTDDEGQGVIITWQMLINQAFPTKKCPVCNKVKKEVNNGKTEV